MTAAAPSPLDAVPEQAEAKRLLRAALADDAVHGMAHAYLFHGPRGVGKEAAAFAFAAELLGDAGRVAQEIHPDLYVLRPLGQMIRIEEIHELHRDLHLRPFEADRRVYVMLDAHLMNRDASDALLKDLEEPPAYAVVVLVADQLAAISPTIRSRCQAVPFRRLSARAVRARADELAPQLAPEERTALARVAGGRLDRLEWLVDAQRGGRRDVLVETARATYADTPFDVTAAAQAVLASAKERGDAAAAAAEREAAAVELPEKRADQLVRRARHGAEKEDLLGSLEELATWFRDLVAVGSGAEAVAINADKLDLLRADALPERVGPAGAAADEALAAWRELERLNLAPQLALESLFVRLRRLLGPRGG